jgi:hypothetical protein
MSVVLSDLQQDAGDADSTFGGRVHGNGAVGFVGDVSDDEP